MTDVPQTAVDPAKRFEGFHRVPKFDPGRSQSDVCQAGFPTIDSGYFCDSTHRPILDDEGEDYLALDLMSALVATLRYPRAG